MLIEREVGHQSLQPAVLFFELVQPPKFRDAEVGILLFPGVEGLLRDAVLPAEIANRSAGLGLQKGVDDLLFREF